MSVPGAGGWLLFWNWALRLWVVEAWIVAALWVWRSVGAAIGLPKVANLLDAQWDDAPATGPMLTVVVPALNEEASVAECLESLLAQDYESLRIVAVDDRSTDGTGAVMDGLAAARYPERLQVLHVRELPVGWLGKTHAMTMAARESNRESTSESRSEYLLFTDADIVFRADALRRSMAYAVASRADHLVTAPTLVLKRWDEAALIGFFEVCAMWASRPWKISDAKAKRDSVGVGAFNLMRREAYEQVGGFEALRMEIIEDIGMGRRVKRAGLRQRVAFGKDLVRVHWAPGAMGVVDVLTKNMFAAFQFQIVLLLGACGLLAGFFVLPPISVMAGLAWPELLLAGLIAVGSVVVAYRALGRYSGISAWYAVLSPFAATLLMYALLRSMVKTLRQGGVWWRGTLYPLKELRKHVAPPW
jgi:cellulose synthase/poly-beta-1,6-N-acetylglucosamine synthase-like glycosyltransferase